jgi:hypothetical protein
MLPQRVELYEVLQLLENNDVEVTPTESLLPPLSHSTTPEWSDHSPPALIPTDSIPSPARDEGSEGDGEGDEDQTHVTEPSENAERDGSE